MVVVQYRSAVTLVNSGYVWQFIANIWLRIVCLFAIVVVCFAILTGLTESVDRSSDTILLSVELMSLTVLIFALIFVYYNSRDATFRAQRLAALTRALTSNPSQAQIASELYLSAEYHRRMALFNNFSSLGVLCIVSFFVAFAGTILNQDTIRFPSVQDLRQNLETQRRLAPEPSDSNYNAHQASITKTALVLDQALLAEENAEKELFSPGARIASAFLLRISVIGVGIYLVIILNRTYKYNNTASAFYRSRLIAVLNVTKTWRPLRNILQ